MIPSSIYSRDVAGSDLALKVTAALLEAAQTYSLEPGKSNMFSITVEGKNKELLDRVIAMSQPVNSVDLSITDFSDRQLADMIRRGCYAKGAVFNAQTRFMLVLAVPFAVSDDVTTLKEAYDAFARWVGGEDVEIDPDTEIQVYDHTTRRFFQMSYDTMLANCCTKCGNLNDDGEGWNGKCGDCADKRGRACQVGKIPER